MGCNVLSSPNSIKASARMMIKRDSLDEVMARREVAKCSLRNAGVEGGDGIGDAKGRETKDASRAERLGYTVRGDDFFFQIFADFYSVA